MNTRWMKCIRPIVKSRSSDKAETGRGTRHIGRHSAVTNAAAQRRGRTLIEALIASLLSLFIGSALLMLVQSTMTARVSVLDGGAASRDLRTSLDTLENNLRNAQMVSGTGAFSAASASSITCYTNTTGTTTARYWLDTSTTPYSFKQTVGGTTTVLLTDVQSITFTYYVSSSSNYTSPSNQWSTTTSASTPTSSEISNIGAIGITVSVTSGGVSRTLTTVVRLRNSPSKPHI
jgi:hypothetical protein